MTSAKRSAGISCQACHELILCHHAQGFAGVDYSTKDRSSGPVQFERDPAEAAEADPFGLDQIISEVGGSPCDHPKLAA